MAIVKFKGIGITAMAGAVPSHIVENLKYTQYFPEEQVKEVVERLVFTSAALQMKKLVHQIYALQLPKS